jgi:dolichyl-phosphate beta-glucosyltransferase
MDIIGHLWYNAHINFVNTIMTLSIVIPAKNEEKRLSGSLLDLAKYIESNALSNEVEVIVVVNNSTDNTLDITKEFTKRYPFINYVNVPFYTGKGGAVAIGFQYAKGDYIGFTDADASSSPKEIFKLFSVLKANRNLDGAIASRYILKNSIVNKQPFVRRLCGNFFRYIIQNFFTLKYKDTQCGLKIFKKSVARSFSDKISTIGWTFDVNLLILSKFYGYKIAEIPTLWTDKEGSHLKVVPTIFSVVKELIQLKRLEVLLFVNRIGSDPLADLRLPKELIHKTISELNNNYILEQ